MGSPAGVVYWGSKAGMLELVSVEGLVVLVRPGLLGGGADHPACG